jgi:DNA (cytosine-5)-methyltransferase 1
MIHHCYLNIGLHRDAPRLWFEGRRLADIGARPGLRFRMVVDEQAQEVRLEFTKDGDRLISGKGPDHPVIDINSQSLGKVLGPVERARAVLSPGKIVVTMRPIDIAMVKRRSELLHRISSGKPLRIGSVFSGAGILDHALHTGLGDVGIATELAFSIERETRYQDCALANNSVWESPNALIVNGSVDELAPGELPQIDLLAAGIPCDGASLPGRARRGLEHAEDHPDVGHLFVPLLEIIRATQPAILALENVWPYRNTTSMTVIRAQLQAMGYELHEKNLSGNELGALEDRDRLCAVAVTKGMEFSWEGLSPVRQKEATLGEVLDPAADNWSTMEGLREKEHRNKAQYKDVGHGTGFRMQIVTAASTSVPTIGKGYSKVRSTEPKLAHPTDPNLLRQLTPQEHSAVKAVPFDLIAGEVPSVQHQMLGQGVIWPAFVAVGRHVGNSLLCHTGSSRAPLRRPSRTESVGYQDGLAAGGVLSGAVQGKQMTLF